MLRFRNRFTMAGRSSTFATTRDETSSRQSFAAAAACITASANCYATAAAHATRDIRQ